MLTISYPLCLADDSLNIHRKEFCHLSLKDVELKNTTFDPLSDAGSTLNLP